MAEELEETLPVSPADPESGITLPDDAVAVEQIAPTDRMLGFDADGNPVTATAEQVKTFATEGFVSTETLNDALEDKVSTEAMEEALAGKANASIKNILDADFNEYTQSGLYVGDGIIKNAPIDTANCRLLVIAVSPYRVTQIAQTWDADRIFFRRRTDYIWYPWQELWHSGNLNTATAASVGLMSSADKIKLNAVASAMSLSEGEPATMDLDDEETVSREVSIRAQRSAQYQMQTDELLYDALEAFACNHPEYDEFAEWLAAKNRIRDELAKPKTQEGGE